MIYKLKAGLRCRTPQRGLHSQVPWSRSMTTTLSMAPWPCWRRLCHWDSSTHHSSGTQATPHLWRLPQKHWGVSIWAEVKRKWPWTKETSSKQHRQKPPPPRHSSSAKQLYPIVIYTWKMQLNIRPRSQSEVVQFTEPRLNIKTAHQGRLTFLGGVYSDFQFD